MGAYTVRWVIQVDADNSEEAAQIAAELHRDPTSTATVYEVVPEYDEDDPTVEWQSYRVPWT